MVKEKKTLFRRFRRNRVFKMIVDADFALLRSGGAAVGTKSSTRIQ